MRSPQGWIFFNFLKNDRFVKKYEMVVLKTIVLEENRRFVNRSMSFLTFDNR